MNKKMLMMFTAMALVMGSFGVNAQEKKEVVPVDAPRHESMLPPKGGHHKMGDKLATDLKLTDAQKEQAKKVREDGREKIKPLMDQMRDIRKQMDEMRKANMEDFEKILTPDQKAQFEKMKAERHMRKEGKKFGHEGRRPMPRPGNMPEHEMHDVE